MMIAEQIKSVDLVDVVKDAGVDLKLVGTRYSGHCPFHNDKNPSFFVFPDNHFKCFGCGVAGDAADFIQQFHSCDFKQALVHLNIRPGAASHEARYEYQERQHKNDLLKLFSEWERCAIHTYSILVRATHKATQDMTPERFEEFGLILDPLPYWENCLDILTFGDDQQKFLLFKEHIQKQIILLSRNYIFHPDFNYKAWLRETELVDG